jgi:hypothetical protein
LHELTGCLNNELSPYAVDNYVLWYLYLVLVYAHYLDVSNIPVTKVHTPEDDSCSVQQKLGYVIKLCNLAQETRLHFRQKLPVIMESEGSLLCSLEPIIEPYPESG